MGIRILLADDDELILKSIESKIHRLNDGRTYEVFPVNNAMDAIQMLSERTFDVCLTDLTMPGISGFSLVEHIRKADKTVPIFVISAHDEYEYVRKAFVLGITDYLVKPVAISELKKKLSVVESKEEDVPSSTSSHNDIVARIVALVEEEMTYKITLKELAERMNISYAHVSTLFNDHMGMSFPNYILKLRMEKAQMLLSDPFLRVGEVAFKLGYDDQNVFSRDYKRYFGKSPNKNRQSIDKKER